MFKPKKDSNLLLFPKNRKIRIMKKISSYENRGIKKELGRLKTEVHFLKPIMYDEYKDLNTHQVSELVKTRIQEKLDELEESKKSKKR